MSVSGILRSLGFVTVASVGTPVPLSATPLVVRAFRIQPKKNYGAENTGQIYLGNSTLSRSTGAGVYAILSQEQTEGESITEQVLSSRDMDLSSVFIDSDFAGDGVLVGYLT